MPAHLQQPINRQDDVVRPTLSPALEQYQELEDGLRQYEEQLINAKKALGQKLEKVMKDTKLLAENLEQLKKHKCDESLIKDSTSRLARAEIVTRETKQKLRQFDADLESERAAVRNKQELLRQPENTLAFAG